MLRHFVTLLAVFVFTASSSIGGVLVSPKNTWTYFKGRSEASSPDQSAWRYAGFNDKAWLSGQEPFYYENEPTSGTAYSGNTLLSDMQGGYTCIFMRNQFAVADPALFQNITFVARCDDGFVAWLNGHEIGRFNMSDGDISFNDVALSALSEPVPWVTNVIEDVTNYVTSGTNVLAIQAFNNSIGSSSDFYINATLEYAIDTTPPEVVMLVPAADSIVRQLSTVEVSFSKDVIGVNAGDLLINNQPATNVVMIAPDQYLFQFPQPAPGNVLVEWAANHGIRDLTPSSNAFGGGSWNYGLNTNLPLSSVYISEFMASNGGKQTTSVHDELGNSPDWIELYNSGAQAVDISGWFLTDSGSELTKWRFPAAVLPARGYLVVYASGRDTNVNGQLHTSFRIDPDPGYLALVNSQTNIISEFLPYPKQYTDVSYGRDRLDPTVTGYFVTPTPGGPNATFGSGFGPEVHFSQVSGTFQNPFTLSLSTADTNYDIRYVLISTNVTSGTAAETNIPTATSMLYTNPIAITNTVQVRARSFPKNAGYFPGPPVTESYIRISSSAAGFTSDLPIILIHNLTGRTVPSATDQSVIVMTFEPLNGVASMTNPPTLVSRAGFNVRGRSTAGLPQKSYALETWDEFNNDRDVEFLGLPKESDWVLFGQNQYDTSFLHNPLIHQLRRNAGGYSSRTRYAEVFLNISGGTVNFFAPVAGDFAGLYTVEEKVKRSANRLDISKINPGVTNLEDINGGYLLKIDDVDFNEWAFYDWYAAQVIVYQYPDGLEMMTGARADQANYIRQYLLDMGAILQSDIFNDPAIGYAAWIDVDSWIDHHIFNTFSLNPDSLRLSAYFYKDRNEKLKMGPLWDFDRSMGTHSSDDRRPFNPFSWMGTEWEATDYFNSASVFNNFWYSRLFQDIDFWQRWIDRWTELRGGVLSTNQMFTVVDSLTNQVHNAALREIKKWSSVAPTKGTLISGNFRYSFPGTYDGEVAFLKYWLAQRANFIDTNFLASPVLSAKDGKISAPFSLTLTAPGAEAGTTTYYTLDGSDPRLPGGGISPKALSGTAPITCVLAGNARVFARNYNPAHHNLTGYGNPPLSSPWSGPVVATFVASTPTLAITEIMYHPSVPTTGTNVADDFEFVELKNTGKSPLSLVGFQFTQGIDFAFTATNSITTLAAGQYVVIVKNLAAFRLRYPNVANIAGEYSGSLDNSGERVVLQGPLQEPMLDFTYADNWYRVTDGGGFSLVIANENLAFGNLSDPVNWRPSSERFGSPGYADPAPSYIAPVVINEAITKTDSANGDTVELWNPTAAPVDITGWFLTDDRSKPTKFRIPTTTIPTNGYALFTGKQLGIGLSSLGEEVYVFSGDGTNLTGYAHGFSFEAALQGMTFGRYVDSLGREHFVRQAANTLGSANAGPQVGPVVISEIMFEPPPSGLYNDTLHEFIELRDISGQPVPLFDPSHPTNTWKIAGGVDFMFPMGSSIPSNGMALVVSFDPAIDPVSLAAFMARYSVPDGVQIFGPFSGKLSNQGDRLALYQPDQPQESADPYVGYVPYVLEDEVKYSAEAPWPNGAVGTGKSLQRIAVTEFGDDPINWVVANPTPGFLDADQDGLPDDWELAHGLLPNDANGENGPGGDPDHDGMGNLQEYLAGTDPRSASSHLWVHDLGVTNNTLMLHFIAVAQKTYTVQFTEDLNSGKWQKLVDVPAQSADQEVEVSDTGYAGSVVRFYRLVTPRVP